MRRSDAIIVGGGPAGSTCAARLREAGLDVVIIDKTSFPRDKVCAGWVTPAVMQSLRLSDEEYARDGRTFQPITAFHVGQIDRDTLRPGVSSHYDDPVSYGIRRCEFDDFLLRRSGVELALSQPIKSIERRDGQWVINETHEAPLLIGAGGHFCPIARHINGRTGGKHGKELVVAAQEIEFPMTEPQKQQCRVEPHVPELYFCSDLAGYAWCFRKGDYLNVGLGREDNQKLSDHVADFATALKEAGRVPQDMPTKFHGHAYILYGHTQREVVDDGALLIGDAAGLAYPQSGEGIRTAVESAILAAEHVAQAAGRYGADTLRPYHQRLIDRFGDPGRPTPAEEHRTPGGLKTAVAAVLLRQHWFVRRVVIDRWFLHRQQPALT